MVEQGEVASTDLIDYVEGLVAVASELQFVGVAADSGTSADSVGSAVEYQKTVVRDSAVGIGHL